MVVSFQPTQDEIYTYDQLFDYLKSRDRCGLVANFSNKIKDFYIIPLDSKSAVPDALMPFHGPGSSAPTRASVPPSRDVIDTRPHDIAMCGVYYMYTDMYSICHICLSSSTLSG